MERAAPNESHPKAMPEGCAHSRAQSGNEAPQQPKPIEAGESEGGEIDTAHGEAGQHRGRAIAPTPTNCTLRYEVCNTAT